MLTKTRTGRTRHRVQQLFYKRTVLVLQVEWHIKGSVIDEHGFSPDRDYTEWRDARPEDVTEQNAQHQETP